MGIYIWLVVATALPWLPPCVTSHTLHLGRDCPQLDAFPNLDVDRLLGIWYVVWQFDTSSTCLAWNLTAADAAGETLFLTETRQLSFIDALGIDHRQAVTAAISIPNPEVPARMRIRWPTSATGSASFTVLDTDYASNMAIFECNRAGLLHRRQATVLSRSRTDVDHMFVKKIRRLLTSANIAHSSFDEISHSDCKIKSSNNWHIDSELFGLLPAGEKSQLQQLARGVQDYDISQIEIIGDGIEQMSTGFRGSLKEEPSNL